MFFIGVDQDPLSNNYASRVIHYKYPEQKWKTIAIRKIYACITTTA
jgi:hypothetical protein